MSLEGFARGNVQPKGIFYDHVSITNLAANEKLYICDVSSRREVIATLAFVQERLRGFL
jgi:hypothetical protein